MTLTIRRESAHDTTAIAELTQQAFLEAPHSSHTEQFIVDALRRDGQLSLSLVAEHDGQLVGHVALSPVTLSDGTPDWYGLGPISVQPDRQGQGIGTQLMRAALAELPDMGARGCVVLGDPGYYQRFGFSVHPGLVLDGVPAEYFQALRLGGDWPTAKVSYAPGFAATA
ncbi:GNAT family N-acetyltransferase [Pseudomonas xantholysinigenes]|uniref:N-acetyltransferase n=1 Tax=Pseudomonas xantholysinigenes TaxID=2745490 RepID=A0A9E6PTL7_9PSED|nr:N-acetyltransferase [Pseudomonas xantholysinigenes]QXI36498.1 N-acetyltransferase [Pseudomonas xantholysinigenes]